MTLTHILLADPHEITREGYMAILRKILPSAQFGQAQNFSEAESALQVHAWDLVIMEIAMPDGDGLDFLACVTRSVPSCRVLVSSSLDESRYGLRLIQNGAAGFVSKAAGLDEFVKGVEAVLEGRSFVSPVLAQHLVQYVKPNSQMISTEILSEREYAVMVKLAEGHTIKEISILLQLSSKTISTYRARLMQKLNLKSLADIVRYCLDNGIVKQGQ